MPFTVRSDHAALQWLMSFKEPEGHLARWLEELQSYDFTVVHRAGVQHTNADALSHQPCAKVGCSYCKKRESREEELSQQDNTAQLFCGALQARDTAEWRVQPEQDTDLQPVMQWLAVGQRPAWEKVTGLSITSKGLWLSWGTLV